MTEMFEGTGLNWSFFDAHESLQYPMLRYDPKEIRRGFGRTLSKPEIAVYSSHAAVLSEFLERGSADYVLVLEDDVIFDTDFPIVEFAAFCAENKIDYMRLFGKHYAEAVRLGFFFDRSIVRYKTSPAGAQAYLMSRNGARKFVETMRSVDETIDFALDSFWYLGMPIYSIFPYPIIERYSPSSIPIPDQADNLEIGERLQSLQHRAMNKARKIGANIALGSSDRQMKLTFEKFRQIF
jgi:glycosyl transferase, family 25